MNELNELDDFINVPEQRIQRPLKDRLNPLKEYNDTEFFVGYRMDKVAFQELLNLVELKLSSYSKNTNRPLTALQQLSLGLSWFVGCSILVPSCVHIT